MNKKLQEWINKTFHHFGYMPIKIYDRDMQAQKHAWQQREKTLKDEKIDVLVQSIRTVNMVKTKFITPFGDYRMSRGYDQTEKLTYSKEYPPAPDYYKFQVVIDFAKLQRIYQELELAQNSYEYEYLKRSILHDIESNIDALMKVGIR